MIRENFDIDYYRSSLSKALPECSIQAQLEQGGQGIVFHAWHHVAKRDLAVKVLAGGAFASLHSARRFRREVEIMSKMHHPNIVQTYDSGVFDGGLWYAMKFIEGIEVSGWQVIERPTERKCVELFIKVCDALAYAHRAGYIHRDIKPNNIQVDADDNPFILDFGLARPLPSEKRDDISAAGHPVGTLNYMSPEQVIGEELLGVQTDIYSLGVVMYEVFSGGELPYPMDGDPIERRRHIIETEPRLIKVFNPKIDQDLSSILCKCLEKHPADRYSSMDALQSDLRNWLAGDAVTARTGNRWYRWKKTARRHKWPLIAALVFVVMLLAGATSTTIMWQRAEHATHIARTELQAGGLITLGSAERDAGRVQDALVMWRQAADLCKPLIEQSDSITVLQFKALQRLADLEYKENLLDDAMLHSAQAITIAESLFERDPEDDKLARLLGFAYKLRGKMAFAAQDWAGAEHAYRHALAIREQLARELGGEASLRVELAKVYAALGRTCRRLGRVTEAYEYYRHEYEVFDGLAIEQPAVPDYQFGLAFACTHLSSSCINQDSAATDTEASRYLQEAEDRVSAALAIDPYRIREAKRLRSAISQHSGILAGRHHGG